MLSTRPPSSQRHTPNGMVDASFLPPTLALPPASSAGMQAPCGPCCSSSSSSRREALEECGGPSSAPSGASRLTNSSNRLGSFLRRFSSLEFGEGSTSSATGAAAAGGEAMSSTAVVDSDVNADDGATTASNSTGIGKFKLKSSLNSLNLSLSSSSSFPFHLSFSGHNKATMRATVGGLFHTARSVEDVKEMDVAVGMDQDHENYGLISPPFGSSHNLHVTFNSELARFEGLENMPEEWTRHCNQQFGVTLKDVPKVEVEGYWGKIPAILVLLRNQLISRGGLECEGIFRLTADKEACRVVKDQINNGTFRAEEHPDLDVNVIATLIKAWFRDCQTPLYAGVDEAYMMRIINLPTIEEVAAELEGDDSVDGNDSSTNGNSRRRGSSSSSSSGRRIGVCPLHQSPAQRALLEWLLDLMALVVMNERINKMSAKNMAILMSPNLYRGGETTVTDPIQALKQTERLCEFTHRLLLARLSTAHNYQKTAFSSPIVLSSSLLASPGSTS